MPTFKLPLSGDVVQSINPFTAFMTGGQFGLVNINLGQSSEPKVEEEVLSDVATYGKQLGRIVHGAPATTNIAFGGDDWKTLYFTSRNHLGSVNVKIAGLPVPAQRQ